MPRKRRLIGMTSTEALSPKEKSTILLRDEGFRDIILKNPRLREKVRDNLEYYVKNDKANLRLSIKDDLNSLKKKQKELEALKDLPTGKDVVLSNLNFKITSLPTRKQMKTLSDVNKVEALFKPKGYLPKKIDSSWLKGYKPVVEIVGTGTAKVPYVVRHKVWEKTKTNIRDLISEAELLNMKGYGTFSEESGDLIGLYRTPKRLKYVYKKQRGKTIKIRVQRIADGVSLAEETKQVNMQTKNSDIVEEWVLDVKKLIVLAEANKRLIFDNIREIQKAILQFSDKKFNILIRAKELQNQYKKFFPDLHDRIGNVWKKESKKIDRLDKGTKRALKELNKLVNIYL